uniref:Putative LOV domain-containing protein n=1 Tax=Vittaria lineata TaxID=38538 RepID=A0A126X1M7_9MONI|nr:putative LOV domain-containing protein [Vittaria lineata]
MGRPVPCSEAMPARARSQEPCCSETNRLQESMSRSYGESVHESLQKLRHHSFVVTDPHLPGHPIVYTSDAFLRMTGYLAEEVLGRNPRFLQGPETDRRSVLHIRYAVLEERTCHMVLLNYTKQGWPFRVVFHMAPIFSQTSGELLHFVGAHKPLPDSLFPQFRLFERPPSGFLKGPSVLSKPIITADNFNSCCQLSAAEFTHQFSGQQKKLMKITSAVLGLVVHELVISNKMMNDKALQGRRSSGKAESGLCFSLSLAFSRIQQSFVICDSKLPGMPIAYASDMFLQLTGYERNEVIGCSCKFLQGQGTDPCAVNQIRDAIREESMCTVRILNYRKDRSSFWNLLHVSPVRDHTGKVVYYVGVQIYTASPPEDQSCRAQRKITPSISHLGAVGAVKVAVRSNGFRQTS